ncbi:hypothetical protein R0135_12990 [Congregibacter variabilis]|uniref:DUF302 domain-containing protein n=1 Tax=Congregibacter variabilis TaxID=3081200 RepID=A0ABZ0I0L8_9GAMM|nr:hypothetical protein R0135_12990 [Congregibacter sp. IMCC43200]
MFTFTGFEFHRRCFGQALAVLLLCLLGAQAPAQTLPTPQVIGSSWVYSTPGIYHNVRADLVQAIEDEGLVISYTAHLASMLRRTANATGATTQVYDNAESLLFCSSELTYELTLHNPHNITLCPYSISIYSLKADPENVLLSIRAPELEQADYAAVHQLLEQIIAATLTW